MKANFKPLGLAAAVATASAGYAGVANAQGMSVAAETELGDLAIVPYYTVLNGYATGVNIINTSDETQVLKFRFRRAIDSMDALDFNVVLSPEDMYTGFLALEADGETITWTSNDNSCTAPAYDFGDNKFEMPSGLFTYREGAETGYIEIISMGSPIDEDQPIAEAALHDSDGMPDDCDAVRDNFFPNVEINEDFDPMMPIGPDNMPTMADLDDRGVIDSETTHQFDSDGDPEQSKYKASSDSLKVSYFIKSDDTGVEFGDNAIHIAGFMSGPAMTNQRQGIFSGDLQGFDHPDLNGGAPLDQLTGAMGTPRGIYDDLRGLLEAESLINDWSENTIPALGATVDTDWVVTIPGQYVMLDLPVYLIEGEDACLREDAATLANISITNPALTIAPCDYRDIPLTAEFTVYDREERGITVKDDDLVVSPAPPIITVPRTLKDEVNVIEWGVNPVLGAPRTLSVPKPEGAKFGWASLETEPVDNDLGICDFGPDPSSDTGFGYVCDKDAITTGTPIVGFVAWQRAFDANPGSNYGRIVEHSRVQSS